MSDKWTADRIPDQSGRAAVVTGANSGLGLITRARAGPHGRAVVLACRNTDKGAAALRELDGRGARGRRPSWPRSTSPASTRSRPSPSDFTRAHDGLDLLINNAGVMAPPRRTHRGRLRAPVRHQPPRPLRAHRPAARRPRGPRGRARGHGEQHRPPDGPHQLRRPATASAATERWRRLRPVEARQPAVRARARSAPARRRARRCKSLAAHPGYAATNLQSAAAPVLDRAVMAVTNLLIAQDAEVGALSLLYAATEPGLEGAPTWGRTGGASNAAIRSRRRCRLAPPSTRPSPRDYGPSRRRRPASSSPWALAGAHDGRRSRARLTS